MRWLAGLLVLVSVPALADVSSGTPRFSWTQPMDWSDGSALTASQITGYQLSCTGAATVSRRIAAASGVPPSQTPDASRFSPGSYTCTLAVYAKKTASDPEVLGAASNATSFTVPQPTPGAPTGFSVD